MILDRIKALPPGTDEVNRIKNLKEITGIMLENRRSIQNQDLKEKVIEGRVWR